MTDDTRPDETVPITIYIDGVAFAKALFPVLEAERLLMERATEETDDETDGGSS